MKFADPTGMEVAGPWNAPLTGKTGVVPQNGGGFEIVDMNWTYDYDSQSYIMSYGFSDFVVNGTNNSNDYFVNYALSGNAAYASSITADHKNAIDWQIANASAKAMEAARAAGDVGRNATIGPYSGSFNEWVVETPENFFHAKR